MKLLLMTISAAFLLVSFSLKAEIVVIVNPNNNINQLEKNEVTDLFMGRFIDFANGEAALPIDYPGPSEIRQKFYRTLTGKTVSQINAYWARLIFTGRASPPRVLEDAPSILKLVEKNPNAIAYIDSQYLNDSVKVVLRVE